MILKKGFLPDGSVMEGFLGGPEVEMLYRDRRSSRSVADFPDKIDA